MLRYAWVACGAKNTTNAILKDVLAFCLLGNIIAYLIPQVAWYYHLYPAIALGCLYGMLFFSELLETIQEKHDFWYISFLAGVIFFIPTYHSTARIWNAFTYFHSDSADRKLIAWLNKNFKQKNDYMFLSMTHNLYSLELYSDAHQIGSFSFCNWEYTRLGHYSSNFQNKLRSYALEVISQDLNQKKPKFVFVDRPSGQFYLEQRIDFIQEYSNNPKFKSAWSHYVLMSNIPPYDVYQRFESFVAKR